MMIRLTALIQQAEVFLARNARCFQVVLNDEDRNFPVSRNHDGTRSPLPAIGAVAAELVFKLKTGSQENAFQRFPVDRRQARHRSSDDAKLAVFDRHPRRALPGSSIVAIVAGLFQDAVECARLHTTGDKGAHRFVHGMARCFRIPPGAGDVERHRMRDILVAFAPDIDRIIDLQASLHCHARDTEPRESSK